MTIETKEQNGFGETEELENQVQSAEEIAEEVQTEETVNEEQTIEELANEVQPSTENAGAEQIVALHPAKKKTAIIIIAAVLAGLIIIGSVFAYFKVNEDVFEVEDLIENMGVITLDSKDALVNAENAYNALSDAEKEKVDNIDALEEGKRVYSDLLAASFENSEEYLRMKSVISGLTELSPKVTFDKAEKMMRVNLFIDSGIEDLILTYPSLARADWDSIVQGLNKMAGTCYSTAKEYGVNVVFQIHTQSSSKIKLFESLNGIIIYNVLD